MAALQFLGKYRETGLLLMRVSLGLVFVILVTPLLWQSHQWERVGSAMEYLDVHGHYRFWGFLGALCGGIGGVLMILGLFFRIGVLLTLVITIIHLVVVFQHAGFYARIPTLEMAILLFALLLIGPGKYSVDKN